ncbi:glycosyltransferase family 4 protein [Fulvimonas yonginensis]|uniref:Glycosyltransferase family 4 protein n=1 Tax=Fulvimonas yonginensis TaxID=1495200 RepID=A0ABU8JEP2_9GAMM
MAFALGRVPSLELNIWAPPGELPPAARAVSTPQESRWLGNLVDRGGISHVMRSGGLAATMAPVKLVRLLATAYRREPRVDVYHINWLQSALPLPRNGKPALITVLGNDLKLLRLPFMRLMLRRMMRGRRTAICPNAEWMLPALTQSFGDIAEVCPVPFGIDPAWYAVERVPEQEAPRRWLVVARLTADKIGPLFDWSRPLFADGRRQLHLFGPMEQQVSVPDWVHYHGPASPEELANSWFPRASGLITLSRHAEGRPQVMLEAMAAGLPIIASRMPAHETVVRDGLTGRLCDSMDGYAAALEELEHPHANASFGQAARQQVMADYGTWDDCARRYVTIYERLLGAASHE